MDCRDQFCSMAFGGGCSMSLRFKSLERLYDSLGILIVLAMISCSPTISGTLAGEKGELVVTPEARVNITSLASQEEPAKILLLNVSSDGEFYTKEKLEPGLYLIEALVPGYKAASVKVNIPTNEDIRLSLSPLKEIGPTSIDVNLEGDAGKGAGAATLTPPEL